MIIKMAKPESPMITSFPFIHDYYIIKYTPPLQMHTATNISVLIDKSDPPMSFIKHLNQHQNEHYDWYYNSMWSVFVNTRRQSQRGTASFPTGKCGARHVN